jgi:hypothetical protein
MNVKFTKCKLSQIVSVSTSIFLCTRLLSGDRQSDRHFTHGVLDGNTTRQVLILVRPCSLPCCPVEIVTVLNLSHPSGKVLGEHFHYIPAANV